MHDITGSGHHHCQLMANFCANHHPHNHLHHNNNIHHNHHHHHNHVNLINHNSFNNNHNNNSTSWIRTLDCILKKPNTSSSGGPNSQNNSNQNNQSVNDQESHSPSALALAPLHPDNYS